MNNLDPLPPSVAFFYACVLAKLGPPPTKEIDIYYQNFCEFRKEYFSEVNDTIAVEFHTSLSRRVVGSVSHFVAWYREHTRENP